MDIIASHQLGLIEQLEAEAVALVGRERDCAQRAVVYHHVADMLGLAHGYALLAAEGALAINGAVEGMERQARRAYWRIKRSDRQALALRVTTFGETLRALDAERCAGLLMAYRLVATPGLSGEADRRLDRDLLAALRASQSARGQADAGVRRNLFLAHQRWAELLFGERIEQAIAELDWPLGSRATRHAIEALRIPIKAYDAPSGADLPALRIGCVVRGACPRALPQILPKRSSNSSATSPIVAAAVSIPTICRPTRRLSLRLKVAVPT